MTAIDYMTTEHVYARNWAESLCPELNLEMTEEDNALIENAYRMAEEFYKQRFTNGRKDGTEAMDHPIRMLNTAIEISSEDLPMTPELIMSVLLHDVADYILFDGERAMEPEKGFSGKFDEWFARSLGELYEISPEKSEYMIGILYSTVKYEEEAEAWRETTVSTIAGERNGSDGTLVNRTIRRSTEVARDKYGLDVCTDVFKEGLYNALQDQSFKPPPYLRLWRAPMHDLGRIIDTPGGYDLEAAFIKALEVSDNLKKPNFSRPSSIFLDAQEVLSYYVPLMELADLNSMASHARSAALGYLKQPIEHADGTTPDDYSQEIMDAADAEGFLDRNDGHLKDVISSALMGIGYESSIVSRAKTIGSAIDKAGKKPDMIGFRVILDTLFDDNNTGKSTYSVVNSIINVLVDQGVMPGHTRANEPAVQINYKGLDNEQIFVNMAGQQVEVHTEGPRKSGYEAIHINFIVNGIGMEVQIFDSKADLVRRRHAHHIFYKLKDAFGEAGRIRRGYGANPKHFLSEYYGKIIPMSIKIEDIERRSDKIRNGEHHLVEPSAIAASEALEMYKQILVGA